MGILTWFSLIITEKSTTIQPITIQPNFEQTEFVISEFVISTSGIMFNIS